jgi:hypothetical protein
MDLSFSEKLVIISGFYVPRKFSGWNCPECFAADYFIWRRRYSGWVAKPISGVPLKFPRKRGFSV